MTAGLVTLYIAGVFLAVVTTDKDELMSVRLFRVFMWPMALALSSLQGMVISIRRLRWKE